jgi:hypothetical protein
MSISRLSTHCQSDSIAARQAVPKHCPLHNRVEFTILFSPSRRLWAADHAMALCPNGSVHVDVIGTVGGWQGGQ